MKRIFRTLLRVAHYPSQAWALLVEWDEAFEKWERILDDLDTALHKAAEESAKAAPAAEPWPSTVEPLPPIRFPLILVDQRRRAHPWTVN